MCCVVRAGEYKCFDLWVASAQQLVLPFLFSHKFNLCPESQTSTSIRKCSPFWFCFFSQDIVVWEFKKLGRWKMGNANRLQVNFIYLSNYSTDLPCISIYLHAYIIFLLLNTPNLVALPKLLSYHTYHLLTYLSFQNIRAAIHEIRNILFCGFV